MIERKVDCEAQKDLDPFFSAIQLSQKASLICEEAQAYSRLGIQRRSKEDLQALIQTDSA
jgi:hypothetical protein